jgi:hypothetical protein
MSDSNTPAPIRAGGSRWLLLIVIAIACLATAGVIVGRRLWIHKNISPLVQRQVDLMAERLKAQQISVGEPRVVEGVKEAEQVVEIDVSGKSVSLVEFDPSKEDQAKELSRVHEEHKSKILGSEQAAEDAGSIVIIGFEDHPTKEKLLEAFRKK